MTVFGEEGVLLLVPSVSVGTHVQGRPQAGVSLGCSI